MNNDLLFIIFMGTSVIALTILVIFGRMHRSQKEVDLIKTNNDLLETLKIMKGSMLEINVALNRLTCFCESMANAQSSHFVSLLESMREAKENTLSAVESLQDTPYRMPEPIINLTIEHKYGYMKSIHICISWPVGFESPDNIPMETCAFSIPLNGDCEAFYDFTRNLQISVLQCKDFSFSDGVNSIICIPKGVAEVLLWKCVQLLRKEVVSTEA